MLDGYHLHWPAGKSPYLIDPNGQRIDMEVERYVPYISAETVPKGAAGPSVPAASPLSNVNHSDLEGDVQSPATAAGSSSDPVPPSIVPPPPVPPGLDEMSEEESIDSDLDETIDPSAPEREKELRREARSLEHLMTHLPKNKYCKYCRRAKLYKKGARRIKIR